MVVVAFVMGLIHSPVAAQKFILVENDQVLWPYWIAGALVLASFYLMILAFIGYMRRRRYQGSHHIDSK